MTNKSSTRGLLNSKCELNCDEASVTAETCASTCKSGMCAPSFKGDGVCCVADDLEDICNGGICDLNHTTPIPLVFVTIQDGARLAALGSASVTLFDRSFDKPMDGSMPCIWLLGCLAAFIASYVGALPAKKRIELIEVDGPEDLRQKEQHADEAGDAEMGDGGGGAGDDGGGGGGGIGDDETLEISFKYACGMVMVASIALVGLFFLVQAYKSSVVILTMVRFMEVSSVVHIPPSLNSAPVCMSPREVARLAIAWNWYTTGSARPFSIHLISPHPVCCNWCK